VISLDEAKKNGSDIKRRADEFDGELNLIKGGGRCVLQEKASWRRVRSKWS